MSSSPRVIIVGGGIGGLCLAHGLRKAGIAVDVYERDRAPDARRDAYLIAINPAGSRSLRACLPDPLWQAFVATAGRGGDFGFLTERLMGLVVVEESTMYPRSGLDPVEDHYAVDRRTLRRLLLTGLDDVVHFDAEFVRYEHSDGRPVAVFADGRRAIGDLLVGADGASSRLCRQYLPQAVPAILDVVGIGHKIHLTQETRAWVPTRLQSGMNTIMVDAPAFLFTSVYQPPSDARSTLEHVTGTPAEINASPYLLGALVADRAALPADLAALDTEGLRHAVDEIVADWHPTLRRLLAESDPATRAAITFSCSPESPPWPTTNVTVLGDAIHAMPPVGGLGGNTALRDARLLTQQLTSVAQGNQALLGAVRGYEDEMRAYGYAAVRSTMTTQDQALSTGALRLRAVRAFFQLCGAVAPLRRQAFKNAWYANTKPRPWELEPPHPKPGNRAAVS